jgi:predicted nucleic acid-binding protein
VASPGDELDQNLESLGRGEGEAIQLLEQIQADILLIDERLGRRIAENRGIKAAGTLGVLRDAHHMGWADAFALYASLKTKTTFRVSPQLEQRFLNSLR